MSQLAFYRRKKGFTQEQLGKALGVSKQLISAWETGGARIDPKHKDLLQQVLQLDDTAILTVISDSASLPNNMPLENNEMRRRMAHRNFIRSQAAHGRAPLTKFPVISEVSLAQCNTAYYPISDWARDHAEGEAEFIQGVEGDFVIRLSGNSMSPKYPPGSLFLVRPHVHPETGDHVVAVLSDGTVVSRIFAEEDDYFHLFSLSDAQWEDCKVSKTNFTAVRGMYQVIQVIPSPSKNTKQSFWDKFTLYTYRTIVHESTIDDGNVKPPRSPQAAADDSSSSR